MNCYWFWSSFVNAHNCFIQIQVFIAYIPIGSGIHICVIHIQICIISLAKRKWFNSSPFKFIPSVFHSRLRKMFAEIGSPCRTPRWTWNGLPCLSRWYQNMIQDDSIILIFCYVLYWVKIDTRQANKQMNHLIVSDDCYAETRGWRDGM